MKLYTIIEFDHPVEWILSPKNLLCHQGNATPEPFIIKSFFSLTKGHKFTTPIIKLIKIRRIKCSTNQFTCGSPIYKLLGGKNDPRQLILKRFHVFFLPKSTTTKSCSLYSVLCQPLTEISRKRLRDRHCVTRNVMTISPHIKNISRIK